MGMQLPAQQQPCCLTLGGGECVGCGELCTSAPLPYCTSSTFTYDSTSTGLYCAPVLVLHTEQRVLGRNRLLLNGGMDLNKLSESDRNPHS